MLESNKPVALVVELGLSGHRERYLKWVSEALTKKGYQVSIHLCSNLGINNCFLEWGKNNLVQIQYLNISMPIDRRTVTKGLKLYLRVRQMLASLEPSSVDLVFFPSLDSIAYFVSIFGLPSGLPAFSGILMRPHFHIDRPKTTRQKLIDKLKTLLFCRLLSNKRFKNFFTIDELLYEHYGGKNKGKLVYLADPAYLSNKEKPPTDIKPFQVLIYGSIDERKGIVHALAAIDKIHEQSDSELRGLKFVFAGRATPKMSSLFERYKRLYPENICIINRYIKDDEESKLFSESALVWVAYVNFYNMSGVLAQAGLAHKPVISNNVGLIAHLVNKYQLGVSVNVTRPEEICIAIKTLFHDKDTANQLGLNGYNKFAGHSVENFQDIIGGVHLGDSM